MEQTQKHENGFMVKLATFIVDKRNLFFLITVIGLIFSAFSRNWVEVENDLSFYLPDDAETKQALNVMEEQFTTYGTAEVMVANITYEEAEALHDELIDVKGVQSVKFDETSDHYARSSALLTVTFDYDASFTDDIYPTVPEKEDCYVRWDRTDLSDLHFDATVTAEYEPYVTTLASKSGEETLLVEGKFREGDSLRAEKADDFSAAPNGAIEAWTLQIPDDGQESHTVRWPLPADGAGDYTVYTEDENGWHKVSGEVVGSYLCFELAGNTFAVVPAAHTTWWVWVLAGIGCAGAILLLLRRRKMNR